MAKITRAVTQTLAGILRSSEGLPAVLAQRSQAEGILLDEIRDEQILLGSAAGDATGHEDAAYPVLRLYCNKVTNRQREKFRRFSGTAHVVIEVWMSREKESEVSELLEIYTDAVTDVLERNRGDWGQGITYGGNYEIGFQAVKSGGLNYIQGAKVTLDVEVSQAHEAT